MDSPERQSVRRALDSLKPYLESYLAQRRIAVEPGLPGPRGSRPDIQALLRACLDRWDAVLSRELPRSARPYIHELLDVRNRWAHEVPFSPEEAARALDTVRLFGALIGVPAPTGTPAAPPRPASPPRARRKETQREAMARIFAEVLGDQERAIREYAAAEKSGEVPRKSNKHGIAAEAYARALLNDGLKKGWLTPP